MATLTFDVAAFRVQFPAFADETLFPDATLQMYWDNATCYMDDNGSYGILTGACRQLALNYLTAHLAAISVIIAGGDIPGQVQASTVDKVSVTLTPPENPNQWQWWLGTTPYGQQLLALLQARSAGGWYVGGLPESGAFRKYGGNF